MSPTEAKHLEDRISRLEKLVALLMTHGDDWLDNPKVAQMARREITQSERDIKAGRYQSAEDVFKELGM